MVEGGVRFLYTFIERKTVYRPHHNIAYSLLYTTNQSCHDDEDDDDWPHSYNIQ